MPNLTVISLSVNKLKSLEDFSHCPNLKELYLRKNLINNIQELNHLTNLPYLDTLWLEENPIAGMNNYRKAVLSILPNLKKLDNQEVTEAEVQ